MYIPKYSHYGQRTINLPRTILFSSDSELRKSLLRSTSYDCSVPDPGQLEDTDLGERQMLPKSKVDMQHSDGK